MERARDYAAGGSGVIAVLMMVEAAFARYQIVDMRMPVVISRHAPIIALIAFAVSWTLLHRKFESASYDFATDPKTDFLSEEPTEEGEYWYSEMHRVSVVNNGHVPITASVRLRGIAPEPPTLTGKLGMPLGVMGDGSKTEACINPRDRAAFDVIGYFSDPHDEDSYFTLSHTYSGAPKAFVVDCITTPRTIDLMLTTNEGPPKTATYELRFVGPRNRGQGRLFTLKRVVPPTWLERWENWLESPLVSERDE